MRRNLRNIFATSTHAVGFMLLSVASFYTIFFLFQLTYMGRSIPEANYNYHFAVTMASLSTNVPLLILILIWPVLMEVKVVRLFTLISAVAPAVAGQAVYLEPEISRLATIVAMGLGVMFLFDPVKEGSFALISYLVLAGLNLFVAHPLHGKIAYLESTSLTHGEVNELIFKISNAILIAFIIRNFHKISLTQSQLLAAQASQLSEIMRLREEAEAARQQAEARLAEIEMLRQKEKLMMQRLMLSARYETLMREQYGKALPAFLRALLEALQEDLSFVGGVAYEVHGTQGTVVATYALPHYQGRTFSGGLPATAVTLREPYLVAISPERAPALRGITTLQPRYVLYLPIYADVGKGETLALLELLFMQAPPAEKVSLIGQLLPRIGVYLWMQGSGLRQGVSESSRPSPGAMVSVPE